jgi:hypothetical protein
MFKKYDFLGAIKYTVDRFAELRALKEEYKTLRDRAREEKESEDYDEDASSENVTNLVVVAVKIAEFTVRETPSFAGKDVTER